MKRRLLAMLLAAILLANMVLPVLPVEVFAALSDSGTCGDNVTWTLADDGTLTISGTGEMEDYTPSAPSPWCSSGGYIASVVIESGVTSIGDYAFYECANLHNATVGYSVASIGDYAFYNCAVLEGIYFCGDAPELGECAFQMTASDTAEAPENALTADELTVYYFVTSSPVEDDSGDTSYTLSKTDAAIKEGVKLSSLIASTGVDSYGYSMGLWKTVRLDSDNYQTSDAGVDRTSDGTTFTYVRYWNGAWQYKDLDGNWNYFLEDDQAVAYYIQKMQQFKEIDISVQNWGYTLESEDSNTNPGWSNPDGQVALTVGVVYEDGTVSPAEEDMLLNSTAIYNYWCDRDIGIIVPSANEDFEISKITYTYSASTTNSQNYWSGSSEIEWNKVEIAEGTTWYDETVAWDPSVDETDPIIDGVADNIVWPAKNTAILVLIYVKAVEKDNNLTVRYWDATNAVEIGEYSIAVDSGVLFNSSDTGLQNVADAAGVPAVDGDYFDLGGNAYIVNARDVEQHININLQTLAFDTAIDSAYTDGTYEYLDAYLDDDGRTLVIEYAAATVEETTPDETAPDETEPIILPDGWLPVEFSYLDADASEYDVASVAESAEEAVNIPDLVLYYLEEKSGWTSPEWNGYPTATWSCEHEWDEGTVLQQVTCLADGSMGYTCLHCGTSKTEVIAATGHELVDGTCVTCGYTEIQILASGTCGDNLTWELTDDGILTISGSGAMTNYTFSNNAPWYTYSDDVQSVIIEKGVTTVGNYAFCDCTSLTNITIPDSVTSIGNSAFEFCTSLTSITIPDSVTSIGDWAFCWCTSLTSITIPDSVTSIGDWAFYWCKSLTTITIPNGVTSIGDYAFLYCTSLTSITIPDGVTSIGDSAFSYCSSLTCITIPDSVTSIGDDAFGNCSSLTSVTFEGSTPPTIGSEAFDCVTTTAYYPDTDAWTEGVRLDYGGTITWVAVEVLEVLASGTCGDNLTWELTDDGTLTISGSGEMTVQTATSLYPWYSYKDDIISVVIEDGVTNVASASFADYSGLTTVTIGQSVTSVDERAFYYCTALSGVTLGKGVVDIGGYAFYFCSSLESITLGESVISIGDDAFRFCKSLTSVTIPASVESIGDRAFYSCLQLQSICVNENNEHYADMDGVLYDRELTVLLYCPNGKTGSYVIPDGVTSIGDRAFYDCDALTSITIPETVTSIGSYAFSDCGSLTSIVLPSSVTSLGENVFQLCISLTDITIPSGVTAIDDYSFQYCTSLTSITIPDSVMLIGSNAFYSCSSLTDIYVDAANQYYADIGGVLFNKELTALIYYPDAKAGAYNVPDGVTSIGDGAFYRRSRLTDITLPNSLTSIGANAFYNCTGLTSIVIPGSVQSIAKYAFRNCKKLTTVEFKGLTPPTIASNAFYNVTAAVYYLHTQAWREDVQQSYGGTLTWICSAPVIDSASLVLGNVLELNVSVATGGIDMADFFLMATIGDSEDAAVITEYVTEGDNAVYTVLIPVHQLYQGVCLTLICDETVVNTQRWTMDDYAASLRQEYSGYTAMMELLDTLCNYAAYAAYLAAPDGAAPSVEAVEAVTQDTLADYEFALRIVTSELKAAVSLYIDDACGLRFKFDAAAWEGCTLYVDGVAVEVTEVGSQVVYEIADMIPQDWGTMYNIQVTDSEGTVLLDMDYSVMSYIYACLSRNTEPMTGLKGLLKSMYLYFIAAEAYNVANSTPVLVTNPTADKAYKMGMDKGDGTILYFNGATESSSVTYRLATTENVSEAVDVYLESVSGGYLLYFMNGSTKTYIRVHHYTDGDPGYGKGSLEFVTTAPSEVMTYDSTANTLVYDYDGNNAYYMGTYGSYSTFSVSNTAYITGSNAAKIDVSQFPARFYTLGVYSAGDSADVPLSGTAVSYAFADYHSSSDYLSGTWTLALDDTVSIDAVQSRVGPELRIYNNAANQSVVIIKSTQAMNGIVITGKYSTTNAAVLQVMGSNDGENWITVEEELKLTSEYADYTIGDGTSYTYLKLVSTADTSQARVTNMTVYFDNG